MGSSDSSGGSETGEDNSSDSGILSSLADWFNSLGEKITSLPQTIADNLKQLFQNVVDSVTALPDKIIDGVKGIFVPEDGYIEEKIEFLKEECYKLGIVTYDMSAIMGKETPLEDINGTMYGQEVSFVDMDIVVTVVTKFRPVIRGFMWLMMVIYNYNQFMGLIGQQSLTLGNLIKSVRGDED